jgi:2-hydroxychromene-2-carboxylate isomerase
MRDAGAVAYDQAQAEAVADNVFGVPLFVFDREPFWGHDRIAILEERLIQAGLAVSSNE